MSIIVSSNKKQQFEIPSEGEHLAVLADVIDLGIVQTDFGGKERVRFIWLTEQTDKNGKALRLMQQFNKSFHEKAALRKAVKSVLGRDPGNSFDIESLIGRTNRVVVEHSESEGRTYANISAILKAERTLPIPEDFVRAKDRKESKHRPNGDAFDAFDSL